jgi:hypothetical protein
MANKSDVKPPMPARMESSALVDMCVVYCGEHLDVKVMLEQLLPKMISKMISCRA